MKKHVVLSIVFTMLFLFGCSSDKTNEYSVESLLEIAVVGDYELPKITNVVYEYETLDHLSQSNYEYNALIITSSAFPEADEEKYVQFYKTVKYPVFFYGTENFQSFAFTKQGMTIAKSRSTSSPYVQGYKNNDDGTKLAWDFYRDSEKKSDDKQFLFSILNVIQSK
ncbi:hypothetical protein [Rubeoparvulum massiliense]|uniref:hypothetical protein n=1 Tax=Rubeoparvulum massiliense TaxID=1631346 RepID=UPI00065E5F21|nr:hypothetical protein [Rubeoparvulum massiliense]